MAARPMTSLPYQQRGFCSKPEKEVEPETEEKETKENKESDSKTEDESSEVDLTTEEENLSTEDVKKIKKLIIDQDEEIEGLKKKVELLTKEYRYQVADNDNTVKRYKTEVEKARNFAIQKFAKDLIEVRDDLHLAMKYTDLEALEKEEDVETLHKSIQQLYQGIEMTSKSFDKTMGRFDVTEYNPEGETFDPNFHEAMFMVNDLDKKAGTVGVVMQSGWKIGDRILRAAKVGCVKHEKH